MLVWQEHATSYSLLKKWQMSHGTVVAARARDDPVEMLAASEGSRVSISHLQKMISTRTYTNIMGL